MGLSFYTIEAEQIRLARETTERAGGRLSYRNRAGKQYVTVVRPDGWDSRRVKDLLREFFPAMQTTSSGYLDTTYRINPETQV